MDCLKSAVATFARCSICNQALTKKDIHPVSKELAPTPCSSNSGSSGSLGASSSSSSLRSQPSDVYDQRYMKYGTKLAAMVKTLQEIRASDATAKVILFSQFDDLKLKVASALEEFGIPNVQLQGQTNQRARIIRE